MIIGIVNCSSIDEVLHNGVTFECLHISVKLFGIFGILGIINVSVEYIKLDVIQGETIEWSFIKLHIKLFLDKLLCNIIAEVKDVVVVIGGGGGVVVVVGGCVKADGDRIFEGGFNWFVLSCCSINSVESVNRMRSSRFFLMRVKQLFNEIYFINVFNKIWNNKNWFHSRCTIIRHDSHKHKSVNRILLSAFFWPRKHKPSS